MTINPTLLDVIVKFDAVPAPQFLLHLDYVVGADYNHTNNTYVIKDVLVTKVPTPVHRPTMRGGSYFSEKTVYKITGIVDRSDLSLLLRDKMLGPNTEFSPVWIEAKLAQNGISYHLVIETHLTNSIQTPNSTELGLVIVGLNLA